MTLLRPCQGFTMVLLCIYQDFTRALLGLYQGFARGLLWLCYDLTRALLWFYQAFTIILLWVYYCDTMTLLGLYYVFIKALLWPYQGCTMVLLGLYYASGPAGAKCKPKAARTYSNLYMFGHVSSGGGCPWDLFGMAPGRLGPSANQRLPEHIAIYNLHSMIRPEGVAQGACSKWLRAGRAQLQTKGCPDIYQLTDFLA